MGQIQSLRKMIDKAKNQDKQDRLNLINQLVLLNSQCKTSPKNKKSFSNQTYKKRKLKHNFQMNANNNGLSGCGSGLGGRASDTGTSGENDRVNSCGSQNNNNNNQNIFNLDENKIINENKETF